jgi:glutaredoxin
MPELVTLYHTSGCHLCEKAKDLLWPFLSDSRMFLIETDIAESDVLIEMYGTKIPVLRLANGSELTWPFDELAVSSFFQTHKI